MTRTTPRRSRKLAVTAAALTIGLGFLLAGCGEDADPADPASPATSEPTASETTTATPTEPATPAGKIIDVTISGDTVDPSGERVDVGVGEEVTLRVTADAPGEIHVHSTPEQEFSYEAGTTELPLTINRPGLVDVESHSLELVIVQLEVS